MKIYSLFIYIKRGCQIKRLLKKQDVNFMYASKLVEDVYAGKIVKNNVKECLLEFVSKPSLETATQLILNEPNSVHWFMLASRHGFSTSVFEQTGESILEIKGEKTEQDNEERLLDDK